MSWSEHSCPMPKAALDDYGRLYLCDCGRLYVGRDCYPDAMSGTRVGTWRRVTRRRWWR